MHSPHIFKTLSYLRESSCPIGHFRTTWKWPIELTSNLVPKPGMMEEEKGLVNQPMVKRSCYDLMKQSLELGQKKINK